MSICPKCGCTIDPCYNVCTVCYHKTPSEKTDGSGTGASITGPESITPDPIPLQKKTPGPIFIITGFIVAVILFYYGVLPHINVSSQPAKPAPNNPKPAAAQYLQQYADTAPPAHNSSGEMVQLQNNPAAEHTYYSNLYYFLWKDTTEDAQYVDSEWVCIDFAEKLHNSAEQYGIKSAIVLIEFENKDVGHAINAFQTTDKGLVFIDCTGSKLIWMCPGVNDHIAYVVVGKEYGLVSIDNADDVTYSYYTRYKQYEQEYKNMLENFNSEVDSFNNALPANRLSLSDTEYYRYKSWAERLERQQQVLEKYRTTHKLGTCVSKESMGIVKNVRIYW